MTSKRKNYKINDEKYEYIGHITCITDLYKNLIIIKDVTTNIFYLNIYGKDIDIKYLIDIDINNKINIDIIAKRYSKQQFMDSIRMNKNVMELCALKQKIQKTFPVSKTFYIPQVVDDACDGCHVIRKIIGTYDCINDIEHIENLLIKDNNTYNMFINQMTSYNSTNNITIIETLYSASILVYVYNNNTLHGHFYFSGKNTDDIPIDVIYHMDKYISSV
jgi:hypothetical protein